MTCAEKCRANGWGPGTLLVGDEGHGPTIIKLTAIGEHSILARTVSHNGKAVRASEAPWTLDARDWKETASQIWDPPA